MSHPSTANLCFGVIASTCTPAPAPEPYDPLKIHRGDSEAVKRAICEMWEAQRSLKDDETWLLNTPEENTDERKFIQGVIDCDRGQLDARTATVHKIREDEAHAWEESEYEDYQREISYLRHGG